VRRSVPRGDSEAEAKIACSGTILIKDSIPVPSGCRALIITYIVSLSCTTLHSSSDSLPSVNTPPPGPAGPPLTFSLGLGR